jgi:hypothetical protein
MSCARFALAKVWGCRMVEGVADVAGGAAAAPLLQMTELTDLRAAAATAATDDAPAHDALGRSLSPTDSMEDML